MAQPGEFAFVDAHHHLWDLGRLHYAWLTDGRWPDHPIGDYTAICRNYLATDLMADGAPVNLIKSVHIETCDGEADRVRETAWLQGVADRHGFPHGIIAHVDLMAEDADAQLGRHSEYANFRGIRMLSFRGAGFLAEPAFLKGFAHLVRRGLIYDMDADYPIFGDARALAERFPDAQIILGHCGFPKARTPEYFRAWRDSMQMLAGAPNVTCKISGLGMIDHAWTIDSIRPWVEGCIEAFGVDRCMFGTNWPVDSLFSDYATLVNAYREIVAGYAADEQDAMFRRNAERFYRI